MSTSPKAMPDHEIEAIQRLSGLASRSRVLVERGSERGITSGPRADVSSIHLLRGNIAMHADCTLVEAA
jgi:hypothetical protein